MTKNSVVAVQRTAPDRVIEDYSRLLDLAKYRSVLKPSKDLILKLNLSWSLYFPACSTQPWQLHGVLDKLTKDKFKKLYPVENRTVVTNVQKGEQGNRWKPILAKYNHPLIDLTQVKWVSFKPKSELTALNRIFPYDYHIPEIFKGKNVLHLPTLKTHGHTMMTGAMKNAFGGLITARRHHCHKMIHEVLVDLLKIQKEIHPRLFAVMDGTVAGNGKGPRTMYPVTTNLLLASEDQVAIDAIAAKMMGFDPMRIKFLKQAHDQGLGCADIKQIDIAGDSIKNINFHFNTSKSPVIFFDQLFRRRLKFLEHLIFHTKLFKMMIFASGFYHDKLWYNTVGKNRIRKFNKTPWARLFQSY